MKKLITAALFCLTLLSQTIFAMSDDTKKEGERAILETFQSVQANMATIITEPHSGTVTRTSMAQLMTNHILICNFTSGKKQDFLSSKNINLTQQISDINIQKR